MPIWLQAGLWGWFAGSALLLGAAAGYFANLSARLTAAIMAFGGGVLISALSFDLMEGAYQRGGYDATVLGFLGGAVVYTLANWYLSTKGARHRNALGSSNRRRRTKLAAVWPLPWGLCSTGFPNPL